MEYIIIGILILLVVLVTISLFKNINEGNITERLGKLENNVTRDLYDFKNDINKNLNEDINALNDKIELRLNMINDKVNERLDENFEKTNKTFTSVLERLSKIDEAQKKIDTLSNDIVSLQGILTDKKSRGIYGEVNYFEHLIKDIKKAEKNILISSPFLQKKKINKIKEILIEKYKSGTRITLCIKTLEEYSDKYKHFI